MELWPHQVRAIAGAWEAIEARRRAVVVAPPGAGKSLVMRQITTEALARGLRVGIFTHRIMLTTQTIKGFQNDGIEFGVISSEHKDMEDVWAPVQICSMDTFYARLPKRNFHAPPLDVVLIDEAHQQKDKKARSVVFGCNREDGTALFPGYYNQGAAVLGFTATPVDLGDFYEDMINAGTYAELRGCGAHIPVVGYCAEVPNEKGLQVQGSGEYSSQKVAARMRVESIFGNVYDWWAKLNPDARPAILFAPGVNESRGFVHQFARKGVCCAHISGETVMMARKNANGVVAYDEWPTSESLREEVLEGSKDGEFKVIANRFVLREALDLPWVYHGIFATMIGGLSTYLQTVGRIQRAYPGMYEAIMQDHGGNYDRHLSPNIPRHWSLGASNRDIAKEIYRKKQETATDDDPEPIACNRCGAYRMYGKTCPKCGHFQKQQIRFVRQLEGELTRRKGRLVKFKKNKPPSADDFFRGVLYRCARSGKTVGQATGLAYAQGKAKGFNVFQDCRSIPVYSKGDPEWMLQVKAVYTWIRV